VPKLLILIQTLNTRNHANNRNLINIPRIRRDSVFNDSNNQNPAEWEVAKEKSKEPIR